MTAMICVSIAEPRLKQAVKAANSSKADCVEIRLDHLEDASDLKALKAVKKPLVVSCMPAWEGGKYRGDEEERVKLLMDCLSYCEYVTIELNTKPNLRERLVEEAKTKGVKVIVSFHDFSGTPSKESMKKTVRREKTAGADIAKAAFTAKSYNDALRTMDILLEKGFGIPLIVISMGSFGRISRILGPMLGSYLTYAAAGKGKESAPGQLTVKEVKAMMKVLK